MIILHAAVEAERFLVWGETPATAATPAKRRGRSARALRAVLSPYSVDVNSLSVALAEAAPSLRIDQTNATDAATAFAWLPTAGESLLPSSPLIAELMETGAEMRLARWSVATLSLTMLDAIDLLCWCGGKEAIAPGVVVGRDLAFWAQAMRFAGSLVARQSFLPGIDFSGASGATPRARWKPVITGADTQRLARLAAALPDACRALTLNVTDNATPPATPAVVALSGFVEAVVDALVRQSPPRLSRTVSTGKQVFDSLHDEWLHALRRAPDGTLAGERAGIAELADQIDEWQRPITVSTATPFRLCFRLEEPKETGAETHGEGSKKRTNGRRRKPGTEAAWHVRYLLQAADDPSLLIPTAQVWNAKGKQAAWLKRDGFKPREYLLSALGQAARISPHVERSLKASAPEGYETDAGGAHEFLQAQAWALEQAGFGVLLPAWWTRKGTKNRLSARAVVRSPKLQGGGGLSLEEIVKFEWEVALGDERLTLAELETLARLKSPLVRVRGQWVELKAEEIAAAIEFWKRGAEGTARVRDIVRMNLGAGATNIVPGGMEFAGVTAQGWIGDLLAQLEGREGFAELPVPDEFHGTLRPYQVRGFSWLAFLRRWGLGACLADDMGLGKTAETLAFVQHEWQADGHRPTLVICPMSVVGNWQKEAERFTPDLPVMIHHGLTRAKGKAFVKQAGKHALVLSSYALLHRDFEILKDVNWSGVILDEAQNIKNPETKQARAARTLPADYRIALTGTPVENNVGDLWSLMEFLNPGLLGTQASFKRNYFVPIQANRDEEATARLKRLTAPFILRRLKTDKTIISDLPDKLEMKVFCTLTKEQASLYAAVVKDASEALDETEGIQRKGVVLATLSKLKQVCNHPAQFLGDNSAITNRSGKLARLTEMLEEVFAADERALVFTQFAEMGAIIQRHLQETFGHEVLFLHGATPKKRRDEMVTRFQSDDRQVPRVFLLSLKAGGTGLNLTGANHVFHFDRWWNPAVENQATDRAFRIGQTRNVQVHKFLCASTLEEKIDEMIERKQEVASRIVGAGEGWLTELSTGALKELFALKTDAVGE